MALPIQSGLINSPLWYVSDILDTFDWNYEEKSGIFFYGSRNQIYFIKVFESSNSVKNYFNLKIHYYMKAHHDYITGVCTITNGISLIFNDVKIQARLVSCGKDKMIRIWSFNEDSGCCCLKEFNISSTDIRSDPTCITITTGNIVICGFDKGSLLTWNFQTDSEYKSFYTRNGDINQIVCRDNKFAIAHKKGFVDIYLLNSYDSITKLTQFRAHHSDVCNIEWNPINSNLEIWGDIATIGKDHQIKLWKIDKNFNIKTLTLPSGWNKQNSKGFNEKDNSVAHNSQWSSICWSTVNNGTLIASNGYGNIGSWKSLSGTELKYFSQTNSTKPHCKSVFGIKEFRNHSGVFVSHSLDRLLNVSWINEQAKDGEYVLSTPCLGGSVMSLDAVEKNNQLAIGGSDNLIRLWRFTESNLNRKSFDVTNIWDGINGKILSLSWHPFREGLLAFGTDTGNVGLINISKEKKIGIPSKLLHQNKVFVTNWGVDIRTDFCGVNKEELKENLLVYSVGNGRLYGHGFRQNQFFDASSLVGEKLTISDFTMHWSMRYFAVGYANGLVNIYATKFESDLVLVCQIKTHSKGINCMRWGPDFNEPSNRYRLAIGSNERFLTVTDLGNVVIDFEQSHNRNNWTAVTFNETLAKFKGHGDRITGIDWSPFDSNRIVTSSYDHTAFVWSVADNSPIVSFNHHQGKVFCCKWSTRDRDLVYTGGEDSNLFAWRPSEQTLKTELNRRRQFMPNLPGVTPTNKAPEDLENSLDSKESTQTTIPIKTVAVVNTKKRSSLFPRTIFSVHHPLETYQNSILDFINGKENYLPCLSILDSRRAVIIKQIEIELLHHKEEKNFDNYFILLIWMGKIGRVVTDSLAMNYSPDWLMAVILECTSATGQVPEEIIRMHVNNTIATKKDPILGATYWLAVGDTKQAIDILVKNDCTREALILAKLRLPPRHPIFVELMPILKENYFKNGCYELSAVCSMLMNKYEDVIESMNRRTSQLASWVTIQILIKYQQLELMFECAFGFVNSILLECLNKNNPIDINQWNEKIKSIEKIDFYSILIDLHRFIWIDKKNLKDILLSIKDSRNRYGKEKSIVLCNQIKSKLITKQVNQSENQLSLYLSYEILLIIIENLNAESNNEEIEFNQLNDLISQYHQINLLGNDFVAQLIGGVGQEKNEKVVELLVNNLFNLKLLDL